MSLLEDRTAAFVVRVWVETRELPGAVPQWRGAIEHVGEGRRYFFRDLRSMLEFMQPYLKQIGIDPGQGAWEIVCQSAKGEKAAPGGDPKPRDGDHANKEQPLPRR